MCSWRHQLESIYSFLLTDPISYCESYLFQTVIQKWGFLGPVYCILFKFQTPHTVKLIGGNLCFMHEWLTFSSYRTRLQSHALPWSWVCSLKSIALKWKGITIDFFIISPHTKTHTHTPTLWCKSSHTHTHTHTHTYTHTQTLWGMFSHIQT